MVPVAGFLCRLCHQFYHFESSARHTHCKTHLLFTASGRLLKINQYMLFVCIINVMLLLNAAVYSSAACYLDLFVLF